MILKFLSKYILEVIPSIIATVLGAYIVTHYINAKPDTDAPKAAVASPAHPAPDAAGQPRKPEEAADKAMPDAKAKAVEKAQSEKAQSEKAASEKASADKTSADQGDNAAEARRRPSGRDKTVAKSAPPAAEAAAPATEDRRDANEIARAAIERLRDADQAKPAEPRIQDARIPAPAPMPDRAKLNVTYAPSVSQPPAPRVQGSTPAVNVEIPAVTEAAAVPGNTIPEARADNPSRPTPPADIPSRPLELHGNAQSRTSVTEDVMSAAKSMFNAVVPR